MRGRLAVILLATVAFELDAQVPIRLATREGYVQIDSATRLFYKVVGSGPDTVVVLHGGPGFHMNYLVPDFVPLAAHHTLLFYDQRNAGRSTLFTDTARANVRLLVSDLEALRRRFGIARLTLLGHSWGALLAGLYAAEHPDRVARMILVGAAGPPGVSLPPYNPMARLDSAVNAARVRNLNAWRGGVPDSTKGCWDYYALWSRGWVPTPVHARRMWGDICNVPQAAMLSATRGYPGASLAGRDITAALAKVNAPTLVIHGDRDPMPRANPDAYLRLLPRAAFLMLPDAGHLPWNDQPAAFFTALDRFLSGGTVDSTVNTVTGVAVVRATDRSPYLAARATVAGIENQLVAAMNRADYDSVSRIYAADAVIFAPGGPPIVGRQAIASFWRTAAKRGLRTIELQLMDVEGSASQINALGKYAIRDAQGQLIDVGKFVATYGNENGRWRLVRDMFNSSMETRSPLEVPDYLPPPPP